MCDQGCNGVFPSRPRVVNHLRNINLLLIRRRTREILGRKARYVSTCGKLELFLESCVSGINTSYSLPRVIDQLLSGDWAPWAPRGNSVTTHRYYFGSLNLRFCLPRWFVMCSAATFDLVQQPKNENTLRLAYQITVLQSLASMFSKIRRIVFPRVRLFPFHFY